MWTHTYEAQTDLPPTAIWPVIADVRRWPEVDANIEWLEIEAEPAPGVRFTLKPRGGPRLAFTIGRFEAPATYSDVCRMPLATMETTHSLQAGPRTVVRVEIRISGPLAPLWGALVGRRHAAGLPAQTERILERARALATRPRGAI